MLPGVAAGDMGAVHRMRVASRRLRELLSVLRADQAMVGRMGRRLRKVTKRLGSIRELDVLLLGIDDLRGVESGNAQALERVEHDVQRAREKAQSKRVEAFATAEGRQIATKLAAVAAGLEREGENRHADRQWTAAVDARIARRAARLREAIEKAGSVYLPDRLHVVRIRLKKLRYGAELTLNEARGPARRPDLAALKRYQDLLGRLHDIQVLIDRVRKIQASLTPPALTTWRELQQLSVSLEGRCRRLHARYIRERHAMLALCDRLNTRAAGRTGAVRRAG